MQIVWRSISSDLTTEWSRRKCENHFLPTEVKSRMRQNSLINQTSWCLGPHFYSSGMFCWNEYILIHIVASDVIKSRPLQSSHSCRHWHISQNPPWFFTMSVYQAGVRCRKQERLTPWTRGMLARSTILRCSFPCVKLLWWIAISSACRTAKTKYYLPVKCNPDKSAYCPMGQSETVWWLATKLGAAGWQRRPSPRGTEEKLKSIAAQIFALYLWSYIIELLRQFFSWRSSIWFWAGKDFL